MSFSLFIPNFWANSSKIINQRQKPVLFFSSSIPSKKLLLIFSIAFFCSSFIFLKSSISFSVILSSELNLFMLSSQCFSLLAIIFGLSAFQGTLMLNASVSEKRVSKSSL